MTKLSSRLSQLRIDNGKTKEELVAYLSITMDSYNRYERGTRQPDLDSIVKLAIFYDVTVDYLLGRDEVAQAMVKREDCVSYKDLVELGMNPKLAHGLIAQIVSKQPFEERIHFGNDKTKYVLKSDLKLLLSDLGQLV